MANGLRPLYFPWPRFLGLHSMARPSLCALSALRGASGGATMTIPGGAGTIGLSPLQLSRARRTGPYPRVGAI